MFENRRDAGRRVAARLHTFASARPVVLGIPRGGVPVAFEVAAGLHAPLDVIVVRKLGVPTQPELAMGALGEDGVRVVNADVVGMSCVSPEELAAVEARERDELATRCRQLRGERTRLSVSGRTVIIVDDGIATGSTASAACKVARAHGAEHIVLAAPVAPADTAAQLLRSADEVICLEEPLDFMAVGQFYADFRPTTDADVVQLLETAGAH